MPRPKSLPKRVTHMTKKPDIDKLIRAVLDALKGVAWCDDSQVVSVYASKRYGQPGCKVEIFEVTE
jgi:crossover junction endodeoxyribonuclease RusA